MKVLRQKLILRWTKIPHSCICEAIIVCEKNLVSHPAFHFVIWEIPEGVICDGDHNDKVWQWTVYQTSYMSLSYFHITKFVYWLFVIVSYFVLFILLGHNWFKCLLLEHFFLKFIIIINLACSKEIWLVDENSIF